MNIRELAHRKGHEIQGRLKRVKDDKFTEEDGTNRVHKRYVDEKGTVYAVNEAGQIAYIAGEDWTM